jgi:hypothetical protein
VIDRQQTTLNTGSVEVTTALVRSGNDTVNSETGEVVIDMTAYLARMQNSDGIADQKALSAAYDRACSALIGDNDVQVEGGRTFKKKSAWRKLARYFNISTSVASVQKEVLGDVFMATVTVRASAPWGQYAEAVGACGTDEESGRRKITMADAIATAETRATNRAVSNLVAMGEVSAEEMSKGSSSRPATAPDGTPAFRTFVMPFGPTKGKRLMDIADADLSGALKWASEKGKFDDFIVAGEQEMEHRGGGV